jgi:hypothetical protein
MPVPFRILLASSLAAAAFSASAGIVNVSFLPADQYWDAGSTLWDSQANLKILATHLQRLGERYLPPDQVLNVEVLQVDLAGFILPSRIRIMNGSADWPRLHLRYTLVAPGRSASSGDEWVSDMNYLHGMTSFGDSEALYYEKRMLDRWFKARFADGAAPG